jgi:hypothetical protein
LADGELMVETLFVGEVRSGGCLGHGAR